MRDPKQSSAYSNSLSFFQKMTEIIIDEKTIRYIEEQKIDATKRKLEENLK